MVDPNTSSPTDKRNYHCTDLFEDSPSQTSLRMGKCSFSYCKARTSSQPTVLIKDQNYVKLPDGVVYHSKDRHLYFTNMGTPHLNDGSVSSVSVDGSDPCTVLSPGQIHTPKQLAFDERRSTSHAL
ncbi:hypothetical protein COCVIDRAFT_15601 [Bipolaris victoriae FI3]|uniref:SMP-30/Gluconolactonase/LRE-like region domain-containing protein n=1 Tax=Bipolaris victoriae (strain FI3) TaxID=930091 RepID=W7ETW1_BIPV3|nr:hypothetical protein COCVIDRAFT_15601 [Bipolaris victoriae FI3]